MTWTMKITYPLATKYNQKRQIYFSYFQMMDLTANQEEWMDPCHQIVVALYHRAICRRVEGRLSQKPHKCQIRAFVITGIVPVIFQISVRLTTNWNFAHFVINLELMYQDRIINKYMCIGGNSQGIWQFMK